VLQPPPLSGIPTVAKNPGRVEKFSGKRGGPEDAPRGLPPTYGKERGLFSITAAENYRMTGKEGFNRA